MMHAPLTDEEILRAFEQRLDKEKRELLQKLIGDRPIIANVLMQYQSPTYAYVPQDAGGGLVINCTMINFPEQMPGIWMRD